MRTELPISAATARGRKLTSDATARMRMPIVGWAMGSRLALKPIVEWCLVALTLPIWGTAVGFLWLVVKLSDPRHPAFFVQWRTGQRGVRYRMYKIRTMVPNAAELEAGLKKFNLSTGPQFKMANDPRVTRVGRLLRKLHVDELPQLFNVLTGTTGLVGIRPATAELKDYKGWWNVRLLAPAGLTGLFQVNRSSTHSFDDRARLEIAYLRRCSFWLDLKILAATFVVAFVQRKGI